jgi:hypothetical protein
VGVTCLVGRATKAWVWPGVVDNVLALLDREGRKKKSRKKEEQTIFFH